MEYEVRVADRSGRPVALMVEAGETATVGVLRKAIRTAVSELDADVPMFLGTDRLPDDLPLRDTGLVAGARLSLGKPIRRIADDHDREVAVVSGLAAGATVRLPDDGSLVLGRADGCDLVLDDLEVSRRHAEVRAAGGAVTITDQGSRNGVGRRGYRIAAAAELADGETAQLGETVIAVRRRPAADAEIEHDPVQGVTRFNRPPRIMPPANQPAVSVPAEPDKPRGFRFPLATVFIPLVMAGVLFVVMPSAKYFLIFLALSPLMAIAHVVSERRGGRKDYKDKVKEFQSGLAAAREQLSAYAELEEHTTREQLPDPAAVVRIGTGPTARLFERRTGDDDFGRLRVGLTDRLVDVRLTGPGAESEPLPTVRAVPATVDLPEAGVLGVAGPRRSILPIARALLAQAAALHAPHDLGIVILTGSDEAADWDWASWLPHTQPHRSDLACRRMVAADKEQAEARIAELKRILDERRTEAGAMLRNAAPPGRRLVVLLDGARRLRALPGLSDVLADGPALGVYAICLDDAEQNLPDECRSTVVVTSPSGSRLRIDRPGAATEEDVLADGMPRRLAARLARALAPVRVLGARFGDDGDLPDSVRYLELAGLGSDPGPDDVVAGWAAQPAGRSTRILLGADAAGPVAVDLRRDGPHALIAGTSGAGKSELLQTLVASLALGNAPDALNLVLVDYKGGSAFADCADLPHCVGMITDLDGHLANRALASLSAELRRRESILAEAGAKDIEDYWAKTGGRLPRLVIVVDEFATLVEEVPEFVTGVVGIGMRGRSLGVHVVLATQRPGGVVNAEMRANVNLRLCLRVTRAEESSDVIDVPDAARISRLHPGRGYLRTGHSDLAPIQCARIGWPRATTPAGDSADAGDPAATVTVTRRRITELGRPRPERPGTAGQDAGHDGDTDLTVLVRAVRAAAERAQVSASASPWLPPLPTQLTVAELATTSTVSSDSPVAAVIGLADHPASQAQEPFVLDLDRSGPVVIAGMSRSGRSTALRGIAASLAANSSPADVHLYALDYGSRALAPLSELPHCGAWVDADEPELVDRLLELFTAEIARRTRLLSAGGFTSLREQRAAVDAANRLPYVVILLDRYETFLARHAEADGGRLIDTFDALLRRGSAVGLLLVLATDRSGFNHRLAGVAATRLVLAQADREDVGVFGLNPREVPRSMPPGRAFAVPAGVEVQIALLSPDPDGAAQAAAVDDLAKVVARRWDGIDADRMPHRVDPLPQSIGTAELAALRQGDPPAAPTTCTVGAGHDHLAPVDVDLAEAGSAFLVSGPPRSGRSTALGAIVQSLAGRSTGELSVILCCPRPSPLTSLASLPRVLHTLAGRDLGEDLEDALATAPGPVAVVVDDAELLAEGPAADVLERLAQTARDDGNLVIAAGTTEDLTMQRYRGWLATVRRSRCGLLLNPTSYVDGEVLEVKLPRSTNGGWPAGRALLIERGSSMAVQVPVADPAYAATCGQGEW